MIEYTKKNAVARTALDVAGLLIGGDGAPKFWGGGVELLSI